jgi:hypothetical protein
MPAVDFVEIILEENPLYENAVATPATGPNRLATEKLYMAGRSAGISANPQYKDRARRVPRHPRRRPEAARRLRPRRRAVGVRLLQRPDVAAVARRLRPVSRRPAGGTVADPDTTTATGVNALNSRDRERRDTALFPASGSFVMGGVNTTYTGKTATSFTGCGNHAATVGGEVIANNVPATCTKWVFSKKAGIVAPTAQMRVNYADEARADEGQRLRVSQLSSTATASCPRRCSGWSRSGSRSTRRRCRR